MEFSWISPSATTSAPPPSCGPQTQDQHVPSADTLITVVFVRQILGDVKQLSSPSDSENPESDRPMPDAAQPDPPAPPPPPTPPIRKVPPLESPAAPPASCSKFRSPAAACSDVARIRSSPSNSHSSTHAGRTRQCGPRRSALACELTPARQTTDVLIKFSRVIDGIGFDLMMLDRSLGNISSRRKSVYTATGLFNRIRRKVFKVTGQATVLADLDAVSGIIRLRSYALRRLDGQPVSRRRRSRSKPRHFDDIPQRSPSCEGALCVSNAAPTPPPVRTSSGRSALCSTASST